MIRSARTAAVVLALVTAFPAFPATAAASAATPPAHTDLLRVTYDNGHGVVVNRLLLCHPAGGSMPSAAQACRHLDVLGGPLGAGPTREMCSMLYGGPETARVTGTWRGRQVNESYSRSNGCQTARWERMEPVLPSIPRGSATASHKPATTSHARPMAPHTPAAASHGRTTASHGRTTTSHSRSTTSHSRTTAPYARTTAP
jgi:Subtilisin inhibitor-like